MPGKPTGMLGGFGVLRSGSKDTKAVAVGENVLSYVCLALISLDHESTMNMLLIGKSRLNA